jgi:plasmid stability protein
MRTTLELDDELLEAAKQRAADEGKTLDAVVEEALAATLPPRPEEPKPYKLQWKVHRGGSVLPGVDIANRDSLYDIMDGITGSKR